MTSLSRCAIAVALLVAVAAAQASGYSSWAWAHSNGVLVSTSSTSPINTTRISEGHYCIFKADKLAWFNYCSFQATAQVGGDGSPAPGFAMANNGWGDSCNPYGGAAVYTFDASGAASDRAFSVKIDCN